MRSKRETELEAIPEEMEDEETFEEEIDSLELDF